MSFRSRNKIGTLATTTFEPEPCAPSSKGLSRQDELATSPKLYEKIELRLLVEEVKVIDLLILRDQLEEPGCTVAVVRDGVEALSVWRDADLVIVMPEIDMPNMTGYQLKERSHEQGCTMPTVGATANARLNEAERCMAQVLMTFL